VEALHRLIAEAQLDVSQISVARQRWPHIDARRESTIQDNPVALVTGANKGVGGSLKFRG
jgi:hypothetical protein